VLRLSEKASRFENGRLHHKSITVAGNQTADKLWVLLPAGGDEPYVLLPLRLPPMLETKYTDGMSDRHSHEVNKNNLSAKGARAVPHTSARACANAALPVCWIGDRFNGI
jgi:hypothetical protein